MKTRRFKLSLIALMLLSPLISACNNGTPTPDPDPEPEPIGEKEDHDFDGLINEIDKYPENNKYTGEVAYVGRGQNVPIDFSFVMDYRNFVDNNQNVFNNNLARLATLITGNTSGDFTLKLNEGIYDSFIEDRTLLLKQFGCIDVEYISTDDEKFNEDPNDVHTVQVGHHNFFYNDKAYDVFFIIFEPSIGSAQNCSNLDLGANTDSYRSLAQSSTADWKDYNIHKGVDVSLNRLMPKIQNYIDTKKKVNDPILYVTGYSRGAGLSNVYTKKNG